MRWSMLVLAGLLMARAACAAESPLPTLRLQLRSEVRLPDDVLKTSQREVAQIFARAGFQVMWTDEAPRFTVTIVADVLGFARAASPVMGAVSPTAHGPIAQAFFRQVGAFARAYGVDQGTVLGHVIAHEVGHLLLATASHSPTGLMRGEWDAAQLRDAARGRLTFTEAQARRIRTVVDRPG